MGITLFIVVGAAVLFTTTYVVSGRILSEPEVADHTLVGLGDPAAETLSSDDSAVGHREWHVTTVTSLSDAEDMLDCLESNGFAERELVVLGNQSFAVRWR